MNSNKDIEAFLPETVVIGPAQTISIPPVAYQIAGILKYGTGGTLFIQGATFTFANQAQGTTFASAKQYLVSSNEVVNVGAMVGGLTLTVSGATVTLYLLRGLTKNP